MNSSLNLPNPQPDLSADTIKSNGSQRIFWAALILGVGLRLLAAIWGDIGPGGDGTQRLTLAVKWAAHPQWEGLSGVWPPFHWYFLGSLIRLWHEPIVLAKGVNFLCGIGAIFVLRQATRPLFGALVSSVCALLLAIFWTHIWLTTSYWVELPYLFLVFLSVHYSMRVLSATQDNAQKVQPKDAFLASVFLALAMLLRHEGLILFGLFFLWYVLNIRRAPLILTFAILPMCVGAMHFIEPWLHGHSYFEFASYVKDAKASENLVQGFTLIDCLKQWILIPTTVPSLLVVLPGLYGLWIKRRLIRYDLFSWMFIAQVLFYLTMTFASGWRPQLRYVMLYFVNLLPYTALVWVQWMQKFKARPVLAVLVSFTIAAQSVGWWFGRNDRRPWGWLPIQIPSASQIALDKWIWKTKDENKSNLRIVAVTPASLSESWSLGHSILVDNISPDELSPVEAYVPEVPIILQGHLPPTVTNADVILIDPNALFYSKFQHGLKESGLQWETEIISPHITAFVKSHPKGKNL